MNLTSKTPEEQLMWWEDRREIKNLMGKYVMMCLTKDEADILKHLWSNRDDICMGTNEGYYKGRCAVAGYFEGICEGTRLKAKLIKNAFSDKLQDKDLSDLYGTGVFDNRPASTPLIEIAEDRNTAKGIWFCHGTNADVTEYGVESFWTWGFYTADFVLEDGLWKIWHLNYENDINTLCGQTWTKENVQFEQFQLFEAVKTYSMPEPNVKVCRREYYSPTRKFTVTPRLPEPYVTFAETFSYGI